jgi:hypothetical protein
VIRLALPEEQQKVLNKVLDLFNRVATLRAPYEERWKRWYQLYRSYTKPRNDNRSNLFIPYIFSTVQTVVPRIIESIFESRPFVSVLPVSPNEIDRAEAAEQLLDYQYSNRIRIVDIMKDIATEAAIYGTSIAKIGWKFTATYDDPFVDHVDLFNFYINPVYKDIETAPWVIQRAWRDKQGILAFYSQFIQLLPADLQQEILEYLDRKVASQPLEFEQERFNLIGLGSDYAIDNLFEILEYWEDDRVVTILDRKYVLRDMPNPFAHKKKPFVEFKYINNPHEFYGIGIPEITEHLQIELNTIRNQRIDNVNFELNKMFTVKRYANINPKSLVWRPGGIIPVDDHNDIQPLEVNHVTANAYNEESIVKSDIKEVTGTVDVIRGMITSSRTTATEAATIADNATQRLKFIIRGFAHSFIRLSRMIIQLNQQFIDTERYIRVFDDYNKLSFIKLAPMDIQGEFDLTVENVITEPLASRINRRAQLVEIYKVLANNPYVNIKELTRMILSFYNINNVDKLFVDTPQPVTGQQQQSTIQQAMDANLNGIPMPPEMMGGGVA